MKKSIGKKGKWFGNLVSKLALTILWNQCIECTVNITDKAIWSSNRKTYSWQDIADNYWKDSKLACRKENLTFKKVVNQLCQTLLLPENMQKTEIGNFAFFPSGYPHNKCQDLKNMWLLKNEKIVKISY